MDNSCTTSNAMLALRKSWFGIRLPNWRHGCVVAALLVTLGTVASAVEVADAQQEYAAGDYAAAIKHAEKGVAETPGNEDWHLVYTQALLAVGRYAEADAAITAATNL